MSELRCGWYVYDKGYCHQPATHVWYDHYRDDAAHLYCKYHMGVARRDGRKPIYALKTVGLA